MTAKCLSRVLLVFFAASGLMTMASAAPGRPVQPLILADFEDSGSAAVWQGLRAERTEAPGAAGQHGLKFEISKWEEGLEPRPGIRLPFANGRGFPSRDFSGYGSIVLDAWIEGAAPAKLGLKLRDENGNDSWTTHAELSPECWHQIVLPMAEASADCDVHKVAEVVLYALRPTNNFVAIIDNLRLLPGDPPPLARFDLRYPNYRNWIFPGARDVEVTCQVETNEHRLDTRSLSLELTFTGGSRHKSTKVTFAADFARAKLKCDRFPAGDFTLEARLLGSGAREMARDQWPVRLLSSGEVAGLKVYVDDSNTLQVDGTPFFPLGSYGSVNTQHLAELADSPFNCLLAYGTDQVPKQEMLRFLDAMQAKGLKLVYCLNDVYPTATYFEGKSWEGITGNDAIAAAIIAAYRDHPAIISWYLNDEIPHRLVPQLTDYYSRVKRADPGRPAFIVLCNRSEFPYFPATTDVFGVDPYPIPRDPITRVSGFVDAAPAAVRDRQPIWLVPQAFAWYQYNSKNADRGHAPTAEELRTGRAPSFEEERCMTYLGLIHGAKGLIYYCYYDLRVLPQYKEMWSWMKSIAGEVRTLTPTLLSADSVGSWKVEPSGIHAALKRKGNRLCLMAANPESSGCTASFTVKGAGSRKLSVSFENRKLNMTHGTFQDTLAPLAVHVYEWSQ
jgi:hypothetical protein